MSMVKLLSFNGVAEFLRSTLNAAALNNSYLARPSDTSTNEPRPLGRVKIVSMSKMAAFCLLLGSTLLSAQVNTYYVNASTGCDALSTGCTPNDGLAATGSGGHGPWQHFNFAMSPAGNFVLGASGTTIHVADGTYVESTSACGPINTPMSFCMGKGGTATQPVIVQCDNGLNGAASAGHCKLREAGNPANSSMMWIAGANSVTVQGFDLGGDGLNPATLVQAGITIHAKDGNGHDVQVNHNYVHDVSSAANDGNGFGNGCPSEGIIVVNAINTGGQIPSNNKFIGNFLNNGGSLANPTSTGKNCNQYHGIYAQGAKQIIENNIIGNVPGSGIKLYPDVCGEVVSNNLVFHAGWWGILVKDNGTGSSGCTNIGLTVGQSTISNNIAVNNGFNQACGGITTQAGQPTNNLYSNNLLIGNAPNDVVDQMTSTASCSGTAWPGTVNTFNGGNGATLANTFVNYQNNGTGNYQPPVGGFPISKGTTTCVSGGQSPCTPTTDFAGVTLSSPPPIGAYTSNGGGPAVTLSPSSLSYGSRLINTSTTLPTTLYNSGGSSLSITSIGITGTNAGDFSQTNTCGPTVAAGANCTITVKFSPTATGVRTASVSISDNAPNSPHTVSLTGTGTVSFVQVNSATQTSGSSIAITYAAAQTAGNLNVVSVMWGDTTSSVSSVMDSKGNSYALALGPNRVTGLSSAIYYAKNITSGSNTVTVRFNQTASHPNVNVLEYRGLDTANPLDVSSSASGSGVTANSGSATTTSANEVIVGAGNPSSVFTAAGTGFSSRIINAFGGISEDRVVSNTGSYNATATLTSGTWVMQMVTFKTAP